MKLFSPGKLHFLAIGVIGIAAIALANLGGCLNPTWVNQLAGGSVVPLAPGDTPFIQMLVINATASKTVDIYFGLSPAVNGVAPSGFLRNILPEQQRGFVLSCPVDQIGLGNPNDLNAPAITITGDGGTYNIPPSAFPLVLAKGRDFDCGDSVVFTVIDDRTNGYGIQVLPGRVHGETQTGPFSGPDTFEILNALYTATGTPPTPIP